jgi:hypothetical protein
MTDPKESVHFDDSAKFLHQMMMETKTFAVEKLHQIPYFHASDTDLNGRARQCHLETKTAVVDRVWCVDPTDASAIFAQIEELESTGCFAEQLPKGLPYSAYQYLHRA